MTDLCQFFFKKNCKAIRGGLICACSYISCTQYVSNRSESGIEERSSKISVRRVVVVWFESLIEVLMISISRRKECR
jgi:hypothetical protein